MKKILSALLMSVLICYTFVGCDMSTADYSDFYEGLKGEEKGELLDDIDNNPYTTHRMIDGEIVVSYDYGEVYKKLNLSEYSDYGRFAEDGIMWVEKSDYSGTKYGYIDYKGNVIMPLGDIAGVTGFSHGVAIIYYNLDAARNGTAAIINTNGKVIGEFSRFAATKYNFLNNGNIYFTDIVPDGGYDSSYMFCKSSEKFVKMPYPGKSSLGEIDYSDGLLLVFLDPGAKYFDAQGRCVIDLNNSNQYYKSVKYAERFRNGVASVTFEGMDGNWYKVKINKRGEWINEPEEISKYDAKTFYNSTY